MVPEIQTSKFEILGNQEISKEDIAKAMRYAKINDDFLAFIDRLIRFKEDTQHLKELNRLINELDSIVKQFSLLELYNLDYQIRLKNLKELERSKMNEVRLSQEDAELEREQPQKSQIEVMKDRLRHLKKKDPNIVQNIIQDSQNIKQDQDLLKALNYQFQTPAPAGPNKFQKTFYQPPQESWKRLKIPQNPPLDLQLLRNRSVPHTRRSVDIQ